MALTQNRKSLKDVSKIDNKLAKMYENQTTAPAAPATPYIDRSDVLLSQMNFIAMNNKSFINFKK